MATIDRRGVTVSDTTPVPVALVADSDPSYSGTSAAANALVLMNALATGKSVLIPYDPNGYSFADNTIALSAGQSIIGDNQVLLKCQTSGYFIHVTSQELIGGPAIVQNVHIDMAGSSATSTAIRFATASQSVYGVQISQILFTNCFEAVGDESHATNYVFDVKMYDLRFINTKGRQIYIRRSRGFMWLDSIRIDNQEAGQTVPVTWAGAEFDDIIGLEINRFDVVGPVGTGIYQSGSTGLVITGTGGGQASVWLNRILVDSSSGNGITILNVAYLNGNWIESFQNLGNGINLTSVTKSELSNILVYGGAGLTGAAAGANGFTAASCANLSISNIESFGSTGQGISVIDTTDCTMVGIASGINTGIGLLESGTSDRNVYSLGQFANNTGVDLTLVGANSRAVNYMASGTFIPHTGAQVFRTGATSNGLFQNTSNYNIVSFNGSAALNGGLGIFGGASGDATALYLTSPGSVRAYVGGVDLWVTTTAGTIFSNALTSKHATAGIGYSTGAGGAITQLTSRTTGVSLNTACGAITLFAAAPAVGTWVSCTVTNSAVAATDIPRVAIKSGTNTYIAHVTAVAAGSFQISFTSIVGTASDSPVINFAIMKGVIS